jgi:hypothetical protein
MNDGGTRRRREMEDRRLEMALREKGFRSQKDELRMNNGEGEEGFRGMVDFEC